MVLLGFLLISKKLLFWGLVFYMSLQFLIKQFHLLKLLLYLEFFSLLVLFLISFIQSFFLSFVYLIFSVFVVMVVEAVVGLGILTSYSRNKGSDLIL